jgi:hypothetical protein
MQNEGAQKSTHTFSQKVRRAEIRQAHPYPLG